MYLNHTHKIYKSEILFYQGRYLKSFDFLQIRYLFSRTSAEVSNREITIFEWATFEVQIMICHAVLWKAFGTRGLVMSFRVLRPLWTRTFLLQMKMICHFKTPPYYNRTVGRFENRGGGSWFAKNWMDNRPRCPPASYAPVGLWNLSVSILLREHSHMMSDGFGVFLTYIPTYPH